MTMQPANRTAFLDQSGKNEKSSRHSFGDHFCDSESCGRLAAFQNSGFEGVACIFRSCEGLRSCSRRCSIVEQTDPRCRLRQEMRGSTQLISDDDTSLKRDSVGISCEAAIFHSFCSLKYECRKMKLKKTFSLVQVET
ncbi:hypothetical protein IscW_ISCW000856 [Ixodes scapularis]|uniref:Uncharacterized protein n=1 Tax=Ixodes scapularis TaxID=6945 RepID=B7P2J5_IXOSC|nr:hypothetical protein IscW_ISCW000856 [Ixodes scapularis]|eukprot:XP_002402455.1 hypothetical protein IscW_ISCW000856 [Ixodes scapularis]